MYYHVCPNNEVLRTDIQRPKIIFLIPKHYSKSKVLKMDNILNKSFSNNIEETINGIPKYIEPLKLSIKIFNSWKSEFFYHHTSG